MEKGVLGLYRAAMIKPRKIERSVFFLLDHNGAYRVKVEVSINFLSAKSNLAQSLVLYVTGFDILPQLCNLPTPGHVVYGHPYNRTFFVLGIRKLGVSIVMEKTQLYVCTCSPAIFFLQFGNYLLEGLAILSL